MQMVDILACHARYTGSSPVGVAKAGNGMGGNEQIVLTECTIGNAVQNS